LHDVLDEFLKYDAKLLKTLRSLMLRPGQLTNEYIAGRRVAYISPLRLFFIVSTVFFYAYARLGYGHVLQSKDWTANTVFDLAYIPVSALLMKLLFRRCNRLYLEHLVFTAHVTAFSDICVLPGILARSQWWFYFAVLLVTPIYLALALRAVYRTTKAQSALYSFVITAAQAAAYVAADAWGSLAIPFSSGPWWIHIGSVIRH
jgi:hypothetical protein